MVQRSSAYKRRLLRDHYGDKFDPMFEAAEQALRMKEIASLRQKDGSDCEFEKRKDCFAAFIKLSEFVHPRMKAVEHKGPDDSDGLPQAIQISVINAEKA